jgi:release factor glutamine methyltransferase
VAEPVTVKQLIEVGTRVLEDSTHIFEDHDVEQEAKDLLAHVLSVDADELEEIEEPPRPIRERYLSYVARRAAGEPFPVLIGYIEFYGLELRVRSGAFIPRPSSELLVDRALNRLRPRSTASIVDVCTGQGPIALAIAAERPRASVWGVDIDEQGLIQGRRNARDLEIRNAHFRRGDLYAALPARLRSDVEMITGHVPYVTPEELKDLPAEVIDHEPLFTLTDHSDDGFALMGRVIVESRDWLKPGGWLLLEVAEDLAKKAERMCRRAGFEGHGIALDDDRLSAVVEAQAPA